MADGLRLLPSRVYYGIDVAVGLARGSRCPNCLRPGAQNRPAGVAGRSRNTLRCMGCGLLYRPVGLSSGSLLEAYYSFVYTAAGVATTTRLSNQPAELRAQMLREGKDRTALVGTVLSPSPDATLCVLGCSWGYEMLSLQAAGYKVVGIEISRTRRLHGQRALALPIYATAAEAARACPRIDLVLSSHVLEHVPRVGNLLRTIEDVLRPRAQIHITPSVERYAQEPAVARLVGREHPIGVTRSFWEGWAKLTGASLEFSEGTLSAGPNAESIAVLKRPAPVA